MTPANAVAYHFAAGNAFFAGVALLCAGLLLRAMERGPKTRWSAFAFTAAGVLVIAFSAAPLPNSVYAVWLALVVAAWGMRGRVERAGYWTIGAACVLSLVLAAWEATHHRMPAVDASRTEMLYVIGDSLALGATEPEGNWPGRLGTVLGIETRNLSHGGATLSSSLSNARRVEGEEAYVIVAVGGNDLLQGRFEAFQRDLRALLEIVCVGERDVLMLELPLPPFHNTFGRAQRRLAAEYGVTLVPKRRLARVLFTEDATIDGLHFNEKGHALLARDLAAILKSGGG